MASAVAINVHRVRSCDFAPETPPAMLALGADAGRGGEVMRMAGGVVSAVGTTGRPLSGAAGRRGRPDERRTVPGPADRRFTADARVGDPGRDRSAQRE